MLVLHRMLRAFSALPPEEARKKGLWATGIGLVLVSAVSPLLRRLVGLGFVILPAVFSLSQEQQKATPSGNSDMTNAQAREVLGVGADASSQEIEAAYHRLMRQLHPDTGGSEYFAKQLNAARDTLLKGKP